METSINVDASIAETRDKSLEISGKFAQLSIDDTVLASNDFITMVPVGDSSEGYGWRVNREEITETDSKEVGDE